MSVAAFIVYGAVSEVTPQAIFSALVYFNLLRLPLMMLPMSIGMFFECKVALDRMTKFLCAAELDSQPERLPLVAGASNAIELEGASFCWEVAPPAPGDENDKKKGGAPGAGGGRPGGPGGPPSTAESPKAAEEKVVVPDVLTNVNLAVPTGSLVAIIGQVGSGKSSLLAGLLGELKRTAGTVKLRGRVAYCPQQAWIQNASVRDNILFGLPFDADKYAASICQCTLTRDLEVLLDGACASGASMM